MKKYQPIGTPPPKPLLTKKYTIEVNTYKDGSQGMKRINDGFSSIELLGLVALLTNDLSNQIHGVIHPTVIERHVIQ